MKKMNLQFFAEGAAEAVAGNEAAPDTADTPENTTALPQENASAQAEPAVQESPCDLPDEQTLRQMQRIAEGKQRMQDWQAQGERLKAFYPSFSFAEMYNGHEQFGTLLRAGVSVRQAYEVTHLPQILTAAMQYAARRAAEKTANAMCISAERPQENGLADRKAGLPAEKRVDSLTRTDIIRILERVGKGDKITF